MSAASSQEAIAIVGMSGRFPGADDLDALWRNLRCGVESVRRFSEEELAAAGIPAERYRDPRYVPARAVLSDVAGFDAALFGISPREAELMAPQLRLFLECAWEALEDAACDPARFPGPIGVFAGATRNRYGENAALSGADAFQSSILREVEFLPTWTSYKLGLTGPSVDVQTACSTSLVAVHLACQSLLAGECDLALAGGATITVPPQSGYLAFDGGPLSPSGHTRAFDARADGTVGGNGVGVVALKRLADAVSDGDRLRAVIRGSAINNDGDRKVGYTAPSVDGQAAVIREALAVAGVDPATVGYLEAHGTATPLGDPIEVRALCRAFAGVPPGTCALGSLKTNLGHLDAAAGIGGLIKTVLALEHREIPPSLHFEHPNPEIDFAASPFFVNAELRPWRRRETPRRAGVSSFGIGGTNAHLVVEEAPPPAAGDPDPRPCQLLPFSAASPTALDALSRRLADALRRRPELALADVAYTLQLGRRQLRRRRMLVASDLEDAAAVLDGAAPERLRSAEAAERPPPVVLAFPGGGSQHPGMGAALYRHEPVYRRWIDRCLELCAGRLEEDLRRLLYPDPGEVDRAAAILRRPACGLPALFATEYALGRLWLAWGLEPQALIGHSLGEYAAACLAGVLSLEEALDLVLLRGRLLDALPAGAMLAVTLSEADVGELVAADPRLAVAAVNGPAHCVVSGPAEAIDELAAALEARGEDARRLAIETAGHSPLVEPAVEDFAAATAALDPRPPRIPCASNVSGGWLTAEEAADRHYWVRHLRRTVRFADGLSTVLAGLERPVIVECGPGNALASLARQHPDGRRARVLSSLPPAAATAATAADRPAWESLLTALGRLWLNGVEVDWQAVHGRRRRRRLSLPPYPFEHRPYWLDGPPATAKSGGARAAAATAAEAEPHGRRRDVASWFYLPSWRRTLPPSGGGAARRWLLLAGDDRLSAALAARLDAAVVVARDGASCRRLADGTWAVDPAAESGFGELLAAVAGSGREPAGAICLWGLAPEDGGDEPAAWRRRFARQLDGGLLPLLRLCRALAAAGGSPRLVTVARGLHDVTGGERPEPARATLLAPCRVVPQEYPGGSCRLLDLDPRAPLDDAVDPVLAELEAAGSEPVVAYRGGHRWLPQMVAAPLVGDRPPRLRRAATYLITGGLGRVGLAHARFLARMAPGAKLVLTCRAGAADPRRRRAVAELETMGAEVLAIAADVADRNAMARALRQAEARFGPVAGVVHAAGLTRGEHFATLDDTRREHLAAHFRPKVEGLWVLAELLRGRPLDFCLLTSSLASLLGGVGFAAYAAANLYLDAFAGRMRQAGEPWLSVNWEGWRGEGSDERRRFGREQAALALEPREGEEVLHRLFSRPLAGQIAVSTADLERRIARWTRPCSAPSARREAPAARSRPPLDTPFVAPRNPLERAIAEVWQSLLGLAPVGVHDDFFELGGHSLLATQVLARLRREHGLSLPLHRFFLATTVAQLARVARRPGERQAAAPALEEGSL